MCISIVDVDPGTDLMLITESELSRSRAALLSGIDHLKFAPGVREELEKLPFGSSPLVSTIFTIDSHVLMGIPWALGVNIRSFAEITGKGQERGLRNCSPELMLVCMAKYQAPEPQGGDVVDESASRMLGVCVTKAAHGLGEFIVFCFPGLEIGFATNGKTLSVFPPHEFIHCRVVFAK